MVTAIGPSRERDLVKAPFRRKLPQSRELRWNVVLGVASGSLVVLCWAGWVVATRSAVTTQLRPYDIALLRYLVASVILAPVLVRKRFGFRGIGIGRSLALVCGAGFPFLWVSSTGMRFAPASDVGAVMIGTMPVFVAAISAVTSGEHFDRSRVIGFIAVMLGIIGIAARSGRL